MALLVNLTLITCLTNVIFIPKVQQKNRKHSSWQFPSFFH